MSKFLLWPWSFPSHFSGLSLGRAWPFGGGHNSAPRGTSVGLQMLSGAPGTPAGKPTNPIQQKTPSKRTSVMFHWCWGWCSCTTSQKARTLQHPVALGYGGWCQNEDIGGVLTCHQLDAGEEIFLPSCKPHAETNSSSLISRNHNFIYLFFFLFFSPLVRCIFALLSLHVCITFFSVPQNRSQGLAAGKYNQSNSYYFSMFHTVVFLLLLVFFFFLPFSSFLSQTRTNTVRLAGNWQASTIQRQWFFF